MIRPATIDAFLNRPLDSWDWMKTYGHPELDQSLNELDPPFAGSKLWLHQKVGLLLALELKRFMFHWEMGGGKTLLTLELIRYRKLCGEKPKAIVFVPYISSVDTWVEEVKKHAPDLRILYGLGSGNDIFDHLGDNCDLFVICYQTAVAMVSETVEVVKRGVVKTKWQLNAKQVREYFSSFDMLVLDEVHRCKSAGSLTYRMCKAISSRCDWALGLTGTPFGKDLLDLWPQFYLIDFGETLSPTLGFYKAAFFNSKINYWGGLDYTFNKRRMPVLKRIIKHRSIHYGVDEFVDMPPKEYIQRTLTLPPENEGYCKASLQQIRDALKTQAEGNYQVVESNYLKLRQLSSGFLTLKGEDNAKAHIQLTANPKLEALCEIVDSVASVSRVVIFHHFVYSNELVSSRLKEMRIGHARIWGGQRNPAAQLKRFREDDDCRVLVINTKSGSSSLNLQHANYCLFFEQPDSPIDRAQAEARVWRPGQGKRVLIYDLLVKDTVDHQLYYANKSGRNLLEELLKGKVEL